MTSVLDWRGVWRHDNGRRCAYVQEGKDTKSVAPIRGKFREATSKSLQVVGRFWEAEYALPRISSFRSQSALDEALVKQSFEAHGREGQRGQGIEICTIHEHQPPRLPDQCQP
ncbi:hypothetical protein BsWGS_23252 [Bradybaena similaris]